MIIKGIKYAGGAMLLSVMGAMLIYQIKKRTSGIVDD